MGMVDLRWPVERIAEEITMLKVYGNKLERKITLMLDTLRQAMKKVSLSVFNVGGFEYGFFQAVGDSIYFDSDAYKHGSNWLPGMPLIESPIVLAARPVDHVIICKPPRLSVTKKTLVNIGVDDKFMVDIDSLYLPSEAVLT